MTKGVVVVDYGIGNVFSVCNALTSIGASPILSGDPARIIQADRVILPGVGSFSRAMNSLRRLGLDYAIADFISSGRPFLGICVGMQVLMERSTEFGDHFGLGHIEGAVERIPAISDTGNKIKIPCVGWEQIKKERNADYKFITSSRFDQHHFYFVHSYMCRPRKVENRLAFVNYHGNNITAMVMRDNVIGVQFHPERSGPAGLSFLDSFVRDNSQVPS
jgi:glutamine amidotransferase